MYPFSVPPMKPSQKHQLCVLLHICVPIFVLYVPPCPLFSPYMVLLAECVWLPSENICFIECFFISRRYSKDKVASRFHMFLKTINRKSFYAHFMQVTFFLFCSSTRCFVVNIYLTIVKVISGPPISLSAYSYLAVYENEIANGSGCLDLTQP